MLVTPTAVSMPGIDLDRARRDAALAFEARDDAIQETDLLGVLGLGILDPAQARPHDGLQIGQHGVVIDARERLCPALGNIRNGVFDEASGIGFQMLWERSLPDRSR